ncbi:exonuclease family protein, partial [Chlamydia psittaci 84-8471/1]
RFMVLLHLQ